MGTRSKKTVLVRNERETANVDDHSRRQGEGIAMSDLEQRRKIGIEDDNQAAKLKIVRDADRKSYGTLNAQQITEKLTE